MTKIIQFLNNVGNHIGGIEQCAINYSKAFSLDPKYNIYTILPNKNICYKDQLVGELFEVSIKNKIKLFISIIFIIHKVRPDFIILHCSRGLKLFQILSKIYKFNIAGVNHGFNLNKFIKHADFLFCINKSQIKQLTDRVKNKKPDIVYFPNVTEVNKNIEKKVISNKVVIGTLSRIDFKYKNLDKIVLAAKIMKNKDMDFIFHIGGDYGEIGRLKKMVHDFGLNDKFLFKGFIKDKANFFSEIDIFCMPSKEETFGISYIEAMAHKVPCIATNTVGAMEIFSRKDSAIIIDKNKEEEIANEIYRSIKLLIGNKELRENIVNESHLIVKQQFSCDALLNRFDYVLFK
ncbi:glycosyltransferase family 4 protein [Rickettsiales bacterium]|nr:glycosyltransferase family 4 protein [Rickettsiales bacterium]